MTTPPPDSASSDPARSSGAPNNLRSRRVSRVREYFRKVDARDASVVDMYTDDVQLYFPKFGIGHGKDAVADFAGRLAADLEYLAHDIDGLHIMVDGDHVIVEGREWGRTADGRNWPDGDVSTGRFCNVFEFDGLLIRRLHIYVDPDFTSSHRERIGVLHRGPA